MQNPPELPPFPSPDNSPDGPNKGPGQEPELPGGEPVEYPDSGTPSEIPSIDPGFPGMPPLTD